MGPPDTHTIFQRHSRETDGDTREHRQTDRHSLKLLNYIIIITNFYDAYILRNLSSEAQQKRIIKDNREQARAKVDIRTRDNRRFTVEMQFGIHMSSVFFER